MLLLLLLFWIERENNLLGFNLFFLGFFLGKFQDLYEDMNMIDEDEEKEDEEDEEKEKKVRCWWYM